MKKVILTVAALAIFTLSFGDCFVSENMGGGVWNIYRYNTDSSGSATTMYSSTAYGSLESAQASVSQMNTCCIE